MCHSGDGVNRNKGKGKDSTCGKVKLQGKAMCTACRLSTHLHSSHRNCPFHKSCAKKDTLPDCTADEVVLASESSEETNNCDLSDSPQIDFDSSTCEAERRAHKRGCPLSCGNHLPSHPLFPAHNSGAPADPIVPSFPERHTPVSSGDTVKP